LVCNNPEKAREIYDASAWVQLTDKRSGQAFWHNRVIKTSDQPPFPSVAGEHRHDDSILTRLQLTSQSTRLKPFELGGAAPFHESRGVTQPVAPVQRGDAADTSARAAAAVTLDHALHVSDEELAAAQEQSRDIAASSAAAARSHEPPEDFFDNAFDCLIMEDPVFAMDGFTYERKRVEEWLENSSR
jgi:hypothetical protein